MQLPEGPAKNLFIDLFRSAIEKQKFSPVSMIRELSLQNEDAVVMVEALSLLQHYCVVYGPTEWQVRPMVRYKHQNGYYQKFGI